MKSFKKNIYSTAIEDSSVCPTCSDGVVTIGTQTWATCNSNVIEYTDTTPIPEVTDPTAWAALTTGAWCHVNNNPANDAIYGKLYNWYAVAGIYDAASLTNPALRKQFAPAGYHVPTNLEMTTLVNYLGGNTVAGRKMKEIGTTHWAATNDATNTSCFTALGSGYRFYVTGAYILFNEYAYWWSSTDVTTDGASTFYVRNNVPNCEVTGAVDKNYGFSVRFIKDDICSDITIGSQIWTGCNLNVDRYSNNDLIPQITDAATWAAATTGAWCYYNFDPANGPIYGKLYNWYAVNDPRGLAPTGYHVPTDAEWTTLTTFLGGASVTGGKLKQTGTLRWTTPNTGATNSSGFTALPGGLCSNLGTFTNINNSSFWWSSTVNGSGAFARSLSYNSNGITVSVSPPQGSGMYIRLIKN